MTRRDAATRGLTLIELVLAMALFALVAVMGAQALTGMIRMRDGLTARSETASDLAMATGLLRADLSAALPMLFYPPGGAAPQSALRLRQGVFAITVGGQPVLRPGADGMLPDHVDIRVEYRLEPSNQTLFRRNWAALTPARDDALSPETPILTGVTALHLRSYWDKFGWVDGVTPPAGAQSGNGTNADDDVTGPAPEVYSDILPDAVEITLETESHGSIILLEALK
ncbi:type II secretion system protein J [Thalassovita gelatinovora]|uniref:Type II secretion system protein J n=1 Tax=Thalassovita gelatinovora TaxID=53501 RepID=A0A0P1F6N3_THAGE|nr:type II secretion system protein GspJ [Thalassovita gelatinovora]QIZ82548.1 prepilin-type N-terminal cleavage/methylation domain-containing protein [Thalassovita gelatinovora]CUH63478.1 type II secretion system protein J [Thalassovita gelatinovora]SEQ67574.1 type II secretion system protein J [Thalassovita gelatinovora]